MNKKSFLFGVGALLLLLSSCSSENKLEGYNFTGKGVLGKLPMAQATKLATLREIGEKINNDDTRFPTFEEQKKMGREEAKKKMQEMMEYSLKFLKEQEDNYSHCLDDMNKDLAADTARLIGMKDLAWENKTKCDFKLTKVELGANPFNYRDQSITLRFNMPDNIESLPDGLPRFALLDKNDKFMYGGILRLTHADGTCDLELRYSYMELGMSELLNDCMDEKKFPKMMADLQRDDSIAKILIVDADQYLEYDPKMTIDGMGPIVFGADMQTLPKAYKDLYSSYEDMMAMDCLVYSFNDSFERTLFTAIGDNSGKIDEIEVESQYIPLKLGDKVLRTGEKVRDVIAKFGKQMTWTYDEMSLNAIGAMENGRVTIKLIENLFTPEGQAKLQKIASGAKVEIVPSDINPLETLDFYQIHAK